MLSSLLQAAEVERANTIYKNEKVKTGDTYIYTADEVTIDGDPTQISLNIFPEAKVIVNGNLHLKGGRSGQIKKGSGFFAKRYNNYVSALNLYYGAKLTLNGKDNVIRVVNGDYYSSQSRAGIQANTPSANGVRSEAIINGNLTVISEEDNSSASIFTPLKGAKGLNASNGALIKMTSGDDANPYLFTTINVFDRESLDASIRGEMILDRINVSGNAGKEGSKTIYARHGSTISFLDGDINMYMPNETKTANDVDIDLTKHILGTGIHSEDVSNIEIRGSENGHLNIKTNGSDQYGVWSLGASKIIINKNNKASFTTNIHTYKFKDDDAGRQHGISSGTTPGHRTMSYLSDSSVVVNGTINIETESDQSYGLRVNGDGSSIILNKIEGQAKSSIVSNGSAVAFTFADGYNIKSTGDYDANLTANYDVKAKKFDVKYKKEIANDENNYKIGGQNIEVHYANISQKEGAIGSLIKIGSNEVVRMLDGHNFTINRTAYGKIIVNTVKDANLLLDEVLATPTGDNNLIEIRNGGNDKTGKRASDIDIVVKNSEINGPIFTDFSKDNNNNISDMSLVLDNTTWNVTKSSKDANVWKEENVKGNFITDISLKNNSIINITHDDDEYKKIYIKNNFNAEKGTIIKLNGKWNNENKLETDQIIIGNTASGNAEIKVEKGLFGDITLSDEEKISDIPVIFVENEHAEIVFTGTASTNNAGEATLVKEGNNYHWKILTAEEIANIPHIQNVFMNSIKIDRMHNRVSENQVWEWDNCYCENDNNKAGVLGRLNIEKYNYSIGEKLNAEGTSVNINLASDVNVSEIYDGYRTHSNVLADIKYLKTNVKNKEKKINDVNTIMASLGVSSSIFYKNGMYFDAVLKGTYIYNDIKEMKKEEHKAVQHGGAFGISLEFGRPWGIKNTNWLIEPQIQAQYNYMYLGGYTLGKKVIDKATSHNINIRAGLRAEYYDKISIGRTNTYYLFSNIYVDALGNKQTTNIGKDTLTETFSPAYFDIGGGIQYSAYNNLYLFNDISVKTSLVPKKDAVSFNVNLGIKYLIR